jgi:DNA-binding response OmpR family regulator
MTESPLRGAEGARVLVVSSSSVLREAHAAALWEAGARVVEAGSADELLWLLVAARTGEAWPLDAVAADPATPGLAALLVELRGWPASATPPAIVLVGEPVDDLRLAGLDRARRPEEVSPTVARALGRRSRTRRVSRVGT